MNRNVTRFWLAVAIVGVLLFSLCSSADACCCCKKHNKAEVSLAQHTQPVGQPIVIRSPWYPLKNVARGFRAAFTPYGVAPRYQAGWFVPLNQ